MKVRVYKSSINGVIKPPSSKSYTHRAVAIASLTEGSSKIIDPLFSRDTLATINACKTLGAYITNRKDLIINGRYEFDAGDRTIDAQNSGTTIRIATAMSALVKEGKTILTGDESLRKRPMKPLLDALSQLGVKCSSNDGKPPVTVYGGGIKGGVATIDGSVSSQFISSLLISSIYAKNDVIINVNGEQVSKPYIDATLAVMNRFNVSIDNDNYKTYYIKRQRYKPTDFRIPPDFSSIAILLASGALLGEVTIKDVDLSLPQADSKIIDILNDMDADISIDNNSIRVREKQLSDAEFNLSDSPDLLPVVAILSLKAKHVRIRGVKHARVKETDRIAILAMELQKLGVDVKEYEDGLDIHTRDIKNAILNAHGDHRLFMVFTIAGMLTEQSIIDGLESVDVSYPNFVDDMRRLGAKIEIL
ncbi:MAG: 3-phosphoshikimate 1-carboxyvinyltransferase [Candidatus Nitrosocaldaceae archaeon]|nr:MAG: 3-phosphoshikimate 1-carboxyvinyltransferase [Candidatus Nitrosocaldaceae archaeon]